MRPITDRLLDQLSDEMREMARQKRAEAKVACEDDDAKLDHDLADILNEVATDRGLLARFAFLLRRNATKQSALAEITGAMIPA